MNKGEKLLMEIGVGTVLYGFCGGYFGKDSYGEKIIEAIGEDWVVVRETVIENNGQKIYEAPNLAFFRGHTKDEMIKTLSEWTNNG